MPLVLSMREEEDVFVGDARFVVTKIFKDTNFMLRRESDGAEFKITELAAVEILEDVMVSAGDLFQPGIVRVVIDAPREVMILRGDKYRQGKNYA